MISPPHQPSAPPPRRRGPTTQEGAESSLLKPMLLRLLLLEDAVIDLSRERVQFFLFGFCRLLGVEHDTTQPQYDPAALCLPPPRRPASPASCKTPEQKFTTAIASAPHVRCGRVWAHLNRNLPLPSRVLIMFAAEGFGPI